MNRKILIVFICVFLLCGCTSNVSEKDNNGLFKDESIKVSEIHDSDIKEYEFLEYINDCGEIDIFTNKNMYINYNDKI